MKAEKIMMQEDATHATIPDSLSMTLSKPQQTLVDRMVGWCGEQDQAVRDDLGAYVMNATDLLIDKVRDLGYVSEANWRYYTSEAQKEALEATRYKTDMPYHLMMALFYHDDKAARLPRESLYKGIQESAEEKITRENIKPRPVWG